MLKHINYDSFVGGSAVPTLNRNDVHAFEIVIPPTEVQTDFSHKVGGAVSDIASNTREISKLTELQEILLSRMSGGK
jgi:type I restriction enzyme S subunit